MERATTCAGTQSGAQLGYDSKERLASWQNQPSNPTTTDSFLYDGEGQRVEQQRTTNGTTTTLVYVGNIEKLNLTAGVETSLYSVQGQRIALSSGGTFLYLGSDVLGSPTAILTASGSLDAAHLYGPYGTVRYSTGSWPAAGGYTGQWSDGPSGLN